MDTGQAELADVVRIVVGALGGAAVGVERQWSGHASGDAARLAGIRTFTLLGGLGALTGWLAPAQPAAAVVLLAAAAALVLAGYLVASRRDVDATTEVAALVVLTIGLLAGRGELALASGVASVTVLLLNEKTRLHSWVSRIDVRSFGAALRFAVMATVVLPLLPEGPVDPYGWVRPRSLWMLVLFFSGLSFVGYLARQAVGPSQGYAVAGLLGGFVSSTNVSLTYARLSRSQPDAAAGLASGVVAASTLAIVRVLVAVLVLNAALAPPLAALLGPGLLVGVAATGWSMRQQAHDQAANGPEVENPLQLGAALQMAVLFQAVFIAMPAVQHWLGDRGLVASAVALGLTDVDALTVSIARERTGGAGPATATLAIAVGVLTNTLMKLVLGLSLGGGRFRWLMGAGLGVMAVAIAATLVVLR